MKFEVQLANSVPFGDIEEYAHSSEWAFEQKLDGERLAIGVKDGKVFGCGRRNETRVDREIADLLSGINGDWVLDGEVVGGVFWVFDLPLAPGITPETAFKLRRESLVPVISVLSARTQRIKLVPSCTTAVDKIRLARWVVDNNAEGLMIKKLDAPYTCGKRSNFSLKAKLVETVDCIITEVGREGKRSVAVSVYDDNGILTDVGSVAVTEKNLTKLVEGDVIEVRYLYCNNRHEPRLYQPVFMRPRPDKNPTDCTIDQLKFGCKTVLPSIPVQ